MCIRDSLQSGPIDLAIVPRWDDDPRFASVLAFVSGARHRVGYRERSLLTHVCDAGPEQHEVLRNLDLIRFMNAGVTRSSWNSGSERLMSTLPKTCWPHTVFNRVVFSLVSRREPRMPGDAGPRPVLQK